MSIIHDFLLGLAVMAGAIAALSPLFQLIVFIIIAIVAAIHEHRLEVD